MDERRQIPRWEIKQPAKVKIGPEGEFVDCVIEDLNLKGLCMSVSTQLPENDPLKMVLELPGYLHLDVGAHIPWVRQAEGRYIYGMSFSTIMDESKEKIYKYLSKNFPGEFRRKWWSDK
ncbi:MAG: PilZ domain-containing protein [Candidatus Omnitrophica bacterium]|nr:PilZ domain-containing protein [Candidatus Omnitrophota bacterium]